MIFLLFSGTNVVLHAYHSVIFLSFDVSVSVPGQKRTVDGVLHDSRIVFLGELSFRLVHASN
jgi:hypothetical protein